MLGLFGGASLALAMIGLYSAIAYHVARRTHEIGVRIALGARGASVVAMVLRRSLALAGTGIVVGLAGALGAGRFIGSLLYGIPPHDPATFATSTAGLVALAVVAAWWPAVRAARIDPVAALREE
jgi:putative ABC transport system permease protein